MILYGLLVGDSLNNVFKIDRYADVRCFPTVSWIVFGVGIGCVVGDLFLLKLFYGFLHHLLKFRGQKMLEKTYPNIVANGCPNPSSQRK